MDPIYQQFINVMGYSTVPAGFFVLFSVIMIWSIIWKGIALWAAARNESKPWFIALLIINTVGILEILYIFYFSKKKSK
ncbi:MAG: DUF5652 family protein [Candidatus Staskawiczbacteria bacterium]|jgi:hypothetical protein